MATGLNDKSKKGYSDLSFDFTANPVTGDVATVSDSVSVKRGISNILLTKNFERLFQPEVGAGINTLLFEPISTLTEKRLEDEVSSSIEAWENRAEIIDINVTAEEENNRYLVSVKFRINNSLDTEQVDIFLSRER